MIHKPKSENYEITSIRTSSESLLPWKDHFQKILICYWIIAEFKTDNEIDDSRIGTKTII